MIKLFTNFFIAGLFSISSIASGQNLRFFLLDKDSLIFLKTRIQEKDERSMAIYHKILSEADRILKGPLYSVVHKSQVPPSGNKHDYMSLAPYFWPNPNTADGLPYIRKDGERNPEINKVTDKNEMLQMEEDVSKLALAYFYSSDEKYARRAALLIRTWFLLPESKMNPNVNFGQAVRGTVDGRGEGVLEIRGFSKVIDAIGLIRDSKAWSSKDQEDIQKWFAELEHWMITSRIGVDEMKAGNNHGVWYDAQLLNYAMFLGDSDRIQKTYQRALNRLDQQMNTDGSFPKELARTNSLEYSVFVMQAFFQIADLAEKDGLDFWNAVTPSGKSLKKGVEFLAPYLLKTREWTHKQIKPFNYGESKPFLDEVSQKIKGLTY